MKVKHGVASEQSNRSSSLKVTVSLQRMQCPSLCPAVRFQQQFLAVKVREPWHVFPVHHNERWCKRKPYCCQSHHLAASCIVALTVGRTVNTNATRTLCTNSSAETRGPAASCQISNMVFRWFSFVAANMGFRWFRKKVIRE